MIRHGALDSDYAKDAYSERKGALGVKLERHIKHDRDWEGINKSTSIATKNASLDNQKELSR